ncbi:hypothetical protein FJZ36_09030 [Candidatus Poribacteria bacterium]|nr:hypothetical protein [Candidatus Poribacteria bacterium]
MRRARITALLIAVMALAALSETVAELCRPAHACCATTTTRPEQSDSCEVACAAGPQEQNPSPEYRTVISPIDQPAPASAMPAPACIVNAPKPSPDTTPMVAQFAPPTDVTRAPPAQA